MAQDRCVLFESYQNDTIPYRIPAMAELWDGSVYALTDFRHCGTDIGFGRVDIRGRRLKGKKWGKEFVLIEGTGVEGAVDCGYGDAALVVDCDAKEILVTLVCGQTIYWHPATTRQNPNRITLMRSLDGGKSWTNAGTCRISGTIRAICFRRTVRECRWSGSPVRRQRRIVTI